MSDKSEEENGETSKKASFPEQIGHLLRLLGLYTLLYSPQPATTLVEWSEAEENVVNAAIQKRAYEGRLSCWYKGRLEQDIWNWKTNNRPNTVCVIRSGRWVIVPTCPIWREGASGWKSASIFLQPISTWLDQTGKLFYLGMSLNKNQLLYCIPKYDSPCQSSLLHNKMLCFLLKKGFTFHLSIIRISTWCANRVDPPPPFHRQDQQQAAGSRILTVPDESMKSNHFWNQILIWHWALAFWLKAFSLLTYLLALS